MAVSLEEDEKRKEDTGTMMQFDLSCLEKFQHSLILKHVSGIIYVVVRGAN